MSASRAYELLSKPIVFQPLAFSAFGLVTYGWMNGQINTMHSSVNDAISKIGKKSGLVSTATASSPSSAATSYSEFERRLEALELNIEEIKSMSDKNMMEIEQRLIEIETTAQISVLNGQDYGEEINEIKSISDTNMNEVDGRLKKLECGDAAGSGDNNNYYDEQINDIKLRFDQNMMEIDGRLKKLESGYGGMPDLGSIDAENAYCDEQIDEIKVVSDGNMQEIDERLKKMESLDATQWIQAHFDDIKDKADENFIEIDERLRKIEFLNK